MLEVECAITSDLPSGFQEEEKNKTKRTFKTLGLALRGGNNPAGGGAAGQIVIYVLWPEECTESQTRGTFGAKIASSVYNSIWSL